MIQPVLALLIASSGLASAQAAPENADPVALVRQLGSGKYAEREVASQALDALGAEALPHLFSALGGPLEVSQRAKKLIHKIQDREFLRQARGVTLVKWDFRDKAITEVLEETEKSGVSYLLQTSRDKLAAEKITFKVDGVPFWEAWERLCRASKLEEPLHAPPLGPAKKGRSRPFDYASFPGVKGLERDTALREALILTRDKTSAVAADNSGAVRVRGIGLGEVLLLECRPQPGLDWLALEDVEIRGLTAADGKEIKPGESLLEQHEATVRLTRENWDHFFEHRARRDRPVWPCDSVLLPLPTPHAGGNGWQVIRGAVHARLLRTQTEICLEDVASKEGKSWQNTSGLHGTVLQSRISDDGRLCLWLHLENHEKWVADYPGPLVRKIRPGVVAFRGPGEIAADMLQVLDNKGRPLPRVYASALAREDGKGVELDVQYQVPGGDETFRLLMLRQQAVTVDFPFILRDVPVIAPVGKK